MKMDVIHFFLSEIVNALTDRAPAITSHHKHTIYLTVLNGFILWLLLLLLLLLPELIGATRWTMKRPSGTELNRDKKAWPVSQSVDE